MDNNESDLPVLIAQKGPLNGQRWSLAEPGTIGRDPTCEIVVPDRQVSRFHARLTPGDEGVLIEDLASKNGCYHNGKRISEAVYLQDGDVLQIALVQNFVFLSSDATMPMEITRNAIRTSPGRLYLDNRSHRVWIRQKELLPPISAPQFRCLQTLFEQPGKVVSRQEMVTAVWGDQEAAGVSDQALDALVRRLRERLAELDPTHAYVVTVRGFGLRLDNPTH